MKVLLISVDGVRPDALVQLSDAHKVFEKGAVSLRASSVVPDEEWEGSSFAPKA